MGRASKPVNINDPLLQNWDTYRFFLAVARAGSISAAAKFLKESPPTVGRKIRELEIDLSARLFERSVSGVKITIIGQKILDNIKRIETEAILLNEAAFGNDQQLEGKVIVAAPSGLGQAIIAPKLNMFHAQSPNITIELLLSTRRVNLLKREADVALRIGDPGQDSIIGMKIGSIGFGIYAGREYLDDLDNFKNIADLEGHNVIAGTGSLSNTKQVIEFENLTKKSPKVLSTDNLFVQLSAVKNGLGLAPLPRYLGDNDPELIEILPGAIKSTADLWILTHPDLKNIARIKTVRKFVANIVKGAI